MSTVDHTRTTYPADGSSRFGGLSDGPSALLPGAGQVPPARRGWSGSADAPGGLPGRLPSPGATPTAAGAREAVAQPADGASGTTAPRVRRSLLAVCGVAVLAAAAAAVVVTAGADEAPAAAPVVVAGPGTGAATSAVVLDEPALPEEAVTRDPFGTGSAGATPTPDPAVAPTPAVVPTPAVGTDAGGTAPATPTAVPTAGVPAGLQVTWTDRREGGWYVFTVVDGTEGTTVAATAGSALGLDAPESDVVFTGGGTASDGAGGTVETAAVVTGTGVLQLVRGQTVTIS